MSTKRSRLNPKVEAATERELGGSEKFSHDYYTPRGIWLTSTIRRIFTLAGVI